MADLSHLNQLEKLGSFRPIAVINIKFNPVPLVLIAGK